MITLISKHLLAMPAELFLPRLVSKKLSLSEMAALIDLLGKVPVDETWANTKAKRSILEKCPDWFTWETPPPKGVAQTVGRIDEYPEHLTKALTRVSVVAQRAWLDAYPNRHQEIFSEIAKAHAWNVANGNKKRDLSRFYNNWLSRSFGRSFKATFERVDL